VVAVIALLFAFDLVSRKDIDMPGREITMKGNDHPDIPSCAQSTGPQKINEEV
jgi:hypothetical protein